MFGFSPQQKQNMQMIGMSLAGADPSMMYKMQQQQYENQLKQYQIQQQQIMDDHRRKMDAEKLRIMQNEDQQRTQVYQDKKNFGKAFGAYNLNPQFGSGRKSDRALPTGDEGNPIAQQFMNMPKTVRQGLADSPTAAAELMGPAVQKYAEQAMVPPAPKSPKWETFKMPDGSHQVLDTNNPNDALRSRSIVSAGGVPVRAQDVMKESPFEAANKDLITEYTTGAAASAERSREIRTVGMALLTDEFYSGMGEPLVFGISKFSKDVLGWELGVDPSDREATRKLSERFIGQIKDIVFNKSERMTDKDLAFLRSLNLSGSTSREAIARLMVADALKAEYENQRLDFLRRAYKQNGGSVDEAMRSWELARESVGNAIFTQEAIDTRSAQLLQNVKSDPSIIQTFTNMYGDFGRIQSREDVAPKGSFEQQEDGTFRFNE